MDSDSLAYSTSAVDVGAALAAAAAATSDERESAPKHDADLFMDREGSSDGGNEGDDDGDPFQRSTDALQAAVQALTLEDSTTSTGTTNTATIAHFPLAQYRLLPLSSSQQTTPRLQTIYIRRSQSRSGTGGAGQQQPNKAKRQQREHGEDPSRGSPRRRE